MLNHSSRGFTIVELLVVIVVIGILSSITVVAYSGVQERAKITTANAELKKLSDAIHVARVSENKVLKDITGSGCTRCVGLSQYPLSIDRIAAAAGTNLDSIKDGDPWGNVYAMDENEMENGSCANRDSISVLPSQSGVSAILIPFFQCP